MRLVRRFGTLDGRAGKRRFLRRLRRQGSGFRRAADGHLSTMPGTRAKHHGQPVSELRGHRLGNLSQPQKLNRRKKYMNKIINTDAPLIMPLIDPIAADTTKADSIFHGIRLACLRWKQLNRGADSRVETRQPKSKNTTIAIEEVRQGLVNFTTEADTKRS
jgi:DNA-directed RNA polymerase subunit K/omega